MVAAAHDDGHGGHVDEASHTIADEHGTEATDSYGDGHAEEASHGDGHDAAHDEHVYTN